MKVYIDVYRKKNNLSQEKLARIVDISLSQMRNIEKGRAQCTIENAIKIKRALKVDDIEKLFSIDEK